MGSSQTLASIFSGGTPGSEALGPVKVRNTMRGVENGSNWEGEEERMTMDCVTAGSTLQSGAGPWVWVVGIPKSVGGGRKAAVQRC